MILKENINPALLFSSFTWFTPMFLIRTCHFRHLKKESKNEIFDTLFWHQKLEEFFSLFF